MLFGVLFHEEECQSSNSGIGNFYVLFSQGYFQQFILTLWFFEYAIYHSNDSVRLASFLNVRYVSNVHERCSTKFVKEMIFF